MDRLTSAHLNSLERFKKDNIQRIIMQGSKKANSLWARNHKDSLKSDERSKRKGKPRKHGEGLQRGRKLGLEGSNQVSAKGAQLDLHTAEIPRMVTGAPEWENWREAAVAIYS